MNLNTGFVLLDFAYQFLDGTGHYIVMPVKVERSFTFAMARGDAVSQWCTGHFDHSRLQPDVFELLRDHCGASRVLVTGRVLGWNRDQLPRKIDHLRTGS